MTISTGTEKMYQTNQTVTGGDEPDFPDGGDSAFGGSIGDDADDASDDLQEINVCNKTTHKPLTFGEWLDLKLTEWV